jgi:hypothetical protein
MRIYIIMGKKLSPGEDRPPEEAARLEKQSDRLEKQFATPVRD